MNEQLSAPIREPLGKRIALAEGKFLWELGKHALHYELIDPNSYLEWVADKLYPQDETQKPTGGMLGLNHINIKDAATVLEMLGDKFSLLKHTLKRPLEFVVAVAAKKMVDANLKKPGEGLLIGPVSSVTSNFTGLDLKTFVHDKKSEAYYTKHKDRIGNATPHRYNWTTGHETADEIFEGKLAVFAPEGHRSEDGELQKAKALSTIFKWASEKDPNSFYLPVAVVPPAKGKITPFKTKTELRIGKPVTYQEMTDEMAILNNQIRKFNTEQDENHQLPELTMDDMLMIEIAKVTPPDRYGYYRPYMRFVGMEDYPF